MSAQSIISNEYLQQVFQEYLQEPIEVFTRNLMILATIQHDKLVEHHVSVWESLTKVEATLMFMSILGWCIMFGFALLGLFVARTRYGTKKRSPSVQFSASKAPGVSVIRPLKGVDCNLYENLASSFRQDYPLFEIIFSVARENDPAIKVVKELMKRYPKVDARLIIGERNVGMNPKINNMITSYETAKYDIIWIMDSNVTVDPGCLGRSVEKLSLPGVGLVHHLPFAVRPDTFGSELEMMFLDTVHAKMYLAINFIGPDSCVVGKSNLYRRSDVESVGGLSQFGKYMAEDNLIARALWRKGLKHEMTYDLAYQPLGSMTTADYFLRRSRWTRIRKYTVTAATVVEPFTESILCGLFASYGFNLLWKIHPLNFFAFHIITWFMLDLSLFQALSGKTIEVENLRGFIMAWALREITALPLYIYSVSGNTVDWRDGTFRLMNNSTVIKIPSPQRTHDQHKRSLSFPSLKLPKGPASPNFSLNSIVVSTMTSVILVIDIVMDILFKSQRNGNPEGFASDSLSLKKEGIENLRRLNEKLRRRVIRDDREEKGEGTDSADSGNNSEDERDYTNKHDPVIRAAGRHLVSSWSKTSSNYFSIPYHHNHESEEDIDNSDSETSSLSPNDDDNEVSSTSRRNSTSSSSSSSSSITTAPLATINQTSNALNTRRPSLLNELFWGVSIGLSMHLQNEKNAIEKKLRRRRSTSISSSIPHVNLSYGVEERQRGRSMSLEL